MLNRAKGMIKEIIREEKDIIEAVVEVEGRENKAYAYPQMSGEIEAGDTVLLNTTAVDLGLGSGGYHFIMAVLAPEAGVKNALKKTGHIMKLRYTPFQIRVLSVEEEVSAWHDVMAGAERLSFTPVVSGSLHSMLVPCVCGIKAQGKDLRVAYVMTDGGALPLSLSRAVKSLKEKGLIGGTVTAGHAFGGDYEAVNLYSAILAAEKVLQAQVIVVMMGPGIAGTGTRWGHSGLELGEIINCVYSLGGKSYTIPRISLAEKRERHRGLSHHTVTALRDVALAPTHLVLPETEEVQKKMLLGQLSGKDIGPHKLLWERGDEGIKFAQEMDLPLKHMGRSFAEDPGFFLAAAAAGKAAALAVVASSSYQSAY